LVIDLDGVAFAGCNAADKPADLRRAADAHDTYFLDKPVWGSAGVSCLAASCLVRRRPV
jgi:hypothetical protein